MKFETGQMGNLLLLGDSGYPFRSYLLKPFENPQTPVENLYNESQIRTKNVIEKTFGIWKRRFPILSIGIRTKLPLTQNIIIAAAILHNIACMNRDELPDINANAEDLADAFVVNNANEQGGAVVGNVVRQEILQYFEHLMNDI